MVHFLFYLYYIIAVDGIVSFQATNESRGLVGGGGGARKPGNHGGGLSFVVNGGRWWSSCGDEVVTW